MKTGVNKRKFAAIESSESEESEEYTNWLDTPVQTDYKKCKRIRSCPVVNHSVFGKAQEYTSDEFWKKMLFSASQDEFPPGFWFENMKLHHKKLTIHSVEIDDKDLQRVADSFISFIRNHGDIHSPDDLKVVTNPTKKGKKASSVVTWSKINKIQREFFVNDFIKRKAEELNLSKSEKEQLKDIIVQGRSMRVFKSQTIILNDKKDGIKEIQHLHYNEKVRAHYFPPTKVKKTKSTKAKNQKKSYYEHWRIFLNVCSEDFDEIEDVLMNGQKESTIEDDEDDDDEETTQMD